MGAGLGRSQVGVEPPAAAAVAPAERGLRAWWHVRHLLVLPSGALTLLFFFVPLGMVAVYSLGRVNIFTYDIEFGWTTANYRRIAESIYLDTLIRSLVLSFAATVGCTVVGFPLAYFISRQSARWQNVLLLAVIVPFWTSFLVRTYAWTNLLQNEGLLDDIVRGLGYSGHLNVLYTSKAVAIGILYSYLPLTVLPIYVALQRIDRELLDAAADLGSRGSRLFRRVILPLSLPGVAAGAVLVGISATGEYVIPEILGGSKTLMLGNVIANQFTFGDYPFGSAIAMSLMMLMLGMLMIFRFANRVEASR